MGLILGIIVGGLTLVILLVTFWANLMAGGSSEVSLPYWPTILCGGFITFTLIYTHYNPLTW